MLLLVSDLRWKSFFWPRTMDYLSIAVYVGDIGLRYEVIAA
jgi:hypothetical protein